MKFFASILSGYEPKQYIKIACCDVIVKDYDLRNDFVLVYDKMSAWTPVHCRAVELEGNAA